MARDGEETASESEGWPAGDADETAMDGKDGPTHDGKDGDETGRDGEGQREENHRENQKHRSKQAGE